jgi:hypothetical protein
MIRRSRPSHFSAGSLALDAGLAGAGAELASGADAA